MADDLPAQVRSCYVNFAEHLLNSYNPNMSCIGTSYRWGDQDWARFIEMISGFGFNVLDFWLVPSLFSREAVAGPLGAEFARQMQFVIDYASKHGLRTKMLCMLSTVGSQWHTHCPAVPEEWVEVRELWEHWTRRLSGLGIVSIFPGDPGGCSRNNCTARTFIDKALEISEIIQRNQPQAWIELNAWGNPFWGWGNIKGPPGWRGEFLQSIQPTAWEFDRARADDAMRYLLDRLPRFPQNTLVAINMGFNSDGDPDIEGGAQDARPWVREIARIRRVVTWDFSLTEGENAILPHYRFKRLFEQRRRELQAAPYSGGICFTMTPALNQLCLYESAQSFIRPHADPDEVAREFFTRTLGPDSSELIELLPLFEIVHDWGSYEKVEMGRADYHRAMLRGVELLRGLRIKSDIAFFPDPEIYRRDLLFYFQLFADLSGHDPDAEALRRQYWDRVYWMYDQISEHVDPRPRQATDKLIASFAPTTSGQAGLVPGKWT